jgi:hypothetical protein
VVYGQKNSALSPGRIVLSREKAAILFGAEDVVDKIVVIHTADTTVELAVSAVIDKPYENTHLSFDAIVHPTIVAGKPKGGVTYVLLNDGTDVEEFETRSTMIRSDQACWVRAKPSIFLILLPSLTSAPITKWYL